MTTLKHEKLEVVGWISPKVEGVGGNFRRLEQDYDHSEGYGIRARDGWSPVYALTPEQVAIIEAIASYEDKVWRPIESAPKDGSEIWAFNGEQARMRWSEGVTEEDRWALWVWADQALAEVDPEPTQPTFYRPLPAAPSSHDGEDQSALEARG